MSWECEPLLSKAKIFFERAFNESRDEPLFGLWCSLGLELLGRAAIANVSPTLLAEPSNDHKYLLHALNRGSERIPKKSITSSQVFQLCLLLFPNYTDDDFKISNALINRRNEELHTGGAAFEEYPSSQWIAGFYKVCNSLCTSLGSNLVNLFGDDEAKIAQSTIIENRNEVYQRISSLISAHKKVFESKKKDDQEKIRIKMEKLGDELSKKRHHRATCPACQCVATLQGIPFGKERVSEEDGEIIVRQAVSPTHFECNACELKLTGYAELESAQLGGQYMRKTAYTPAEYYGLIHPDDIEDYLPDYRDYQPEYDNEQ
jgi:hypothetical protein